MELLVVVGVIATFGVLLFPAAGSAIESSKSSACLSNLRQLVAACQCWSVDNDGVLIPIARGTVATDAVVWRGLIAPYVSNNSTVFRCPADKQARKESLNERGTLPASYGINYNKEKVGSVLISQLHEYLGNCIGKRMANVRTPSDTIMISDVGIPSSPEESPDKWIESTKDRGGSYGYTRFWPGTADSWYLFPRHRGGKANAAFYDGHAASVNVMEDIVAHPSSTNSATIDALCIYDNN